MALESDQDAGRAGLPFEPKRGSQRDKKRDKKKAASDQPPSAQNAAKAVSKPKSKDSSSQVSAKAQAKADEILAGRKSKAKAGLEKGVAGSKTARSSADSGAIPEVVSRRMLRRMAILSGAPVFLGVGVFFLAYYLRSHQILDFPPVAVLLVTMGCFGLGVLGLTYGVLSASWDTEPGSLVGLSEFKLNFGRVMDARKAAN